MNTKLNTLPLGNQFGVFRDMDDDDDDDLQASADPE